MQQALHVAGIMDTWPGPSFSASYDLFLKYTAQLSLHNVTLSYPLSDFPSDLAEVVPARVTSYWIWDTTQLLPCHIAVAYAWLRLCLVSACKSVAGFTSHMVVWKRRPFQAVPPCAHSVNFISALWLLHG